MNKRSPFKGCLAGAPENGDGDAANIRRGNAHKTSYNLSAPAKAHLSSLPAAAAFPAPSRGETGGLCPHPLKGFIP